MADVLRDRIEDAYARGYMAASDADAIADDVLLQERNRLWDALDHIARLHGPAARIAQAALEHEANLMGSTFKRTDA